MRWSVLALLLVADASLSAAHACSVCGCDPAAGTLAVDRPSPRTARLGLEDRYLTKESGGGDSSEREKEQRVLLRLQYAPVQRLVLQAEAPVYLYRRHFDAMGNNDDIARGLGDVALGARWEALRVGFDARHVLSVTGMLKLPTGSSDRHLPGADWDPHLQLGTGSYDGQGGITYLYGPHPWTLYASLTGRVNSANARGFRYGNALFGSVGARRGFGELRQLVLSLEAQLRSAGRDRSSDGSTDPDSGGQILYATTSASYLFEAGWLVRALVQIPTVTRLNGSQSEHPVGYLQVAYDFEL